MPAAQLLSATLETAINTLLSLDESAKSQLPRLQGKQLMISLTEIPESLVLVFSSSIDVLSVTKPAASQALPPEGVDCYLATNLMTLPELRNISNITQLIKQDKLQIEGDIQVAQQFSQVIKNLDIDWEGQLAKYTGDVLAHEFFQAAQKLKAGLFGMKQRLDISLKDAALEEKKLAAPALLVEEFNTQVNELQQRTQQLERRLSSYHQQSE